VRSRMNGPDDLVRLEKVKEKRGTEEVDELVREFLRFDECSVPICRNCESEYEFEFDYSEELRIRVRCPGCGRTMTWQQEKPVEVWSGLHVNYFLERYREGEPIRCPYDDCQVSVVEHSDDSLEFRCLYCNRRSVNRR